MTAVIPDPLNLNQLITNVLLVDRTLYMNSYTFTSNNVYISGNNLIFNYPNVLDITTNNIVLNNIPSNLDNVYIEENVPTLGYSTINNNDDVDCRGVEFIWIDSNYINNNIFYDGFFGYDTPRNRFVFYPNAIPSNPSGRLRNNYFSRQIQQQDPINFDMDEIYTSYIINADYNNFNTQNNVTNLEINSTENLKIVSSNNLTITILNNLIENITGTKNINIDNNIYYNVTNDVVINSTDTIFGTNTTNFTGINLNIITTNSFQISSSTNNNNIIFNNNGEIVPTGNIYIGSNSSRFANIYCSEFNTTSIIMSTDTLLSNISDIIFDVNNTININSQIKLNNNISINDDITINVDNIYFNNNFIINNNLIFIDIYNNRIGINNNAPLYTLDINGNMFVYEKGIFDKDITIGLTLNNYVIINSSNLYSQNNINIGNNILFINKTMNNIGINTNDPNNNYKLDVNGDLYINDILTIDNDIVFCTDNINKAIVLNNTDLNCLQYININNYTLYINNQNINIGSGLIDNNLLKVFGNTYIDGHSYFNSDVSFCNNSLNNITIYSQIINSLDDITINNNNIYIDNINANIGINKIPTSKLDVNYVMTTNNLIEFIKYESYFNMSESLFMNLCTTLDHESKIIFNYQLNNGNIVFIDAVITAISINSSDCNTLDGAKGGEVFTITYMIGINMTNNIINNIGQDINTIKQSYNSLVNVSYEIMNDTIYFIVSGEVGYTYNWNINCKIYLIIN